jgi:hypothetical protein
MLTEFEFIARLLDLKPTLMVGIAEEPDTRTRDLATIKEWMSQGKETRVYGLALKASRMRV